ncbi:MAG: hypothetical protein Q4A55_02135 [Aerococcus sp.]|nr:hypothetical protein [Aerococcus sp.]
MTANTIASLSALIAVGINLYLIYRARHTPLANDSRKLLRSISIAFLVIAVIVITFGSQLNLQ